MVMEFCGGGEIFFHMNKVQRFSEKVSKFYFAEILLAIEYLHMHKIFYRDLKPENILLDEEGHIRIADFGISRINFSTRERSNSFCGSPEYMSPEMLRPGRMHGRSVDFYALGALLYEMLTGLPPHFSESREEMYRRILHNPVDYPRYLSINAKHLLKGLLCKDPENRLGAKRGAEELKEHPFCRDIDWKAVLEKRLIPPIKPSLRYSNFDQEYTNTPVRFTFEEDMVKEPYQRRRSDPGVDKSTVHGYIGGASGVDHSSQNRHLGTHGNQDDTSPHYSRPPSSTFRGYSFMNFRNDSVSSSIDQQQQQNFSETSHRVSLKDAQQVPGNQQSPYPSP